MIRTLQMPDGTHIDVEAHQDEDGKAIYRIGVSVPHPDMVSNVIVEAWDKSDYN